MCAPLCQSRRACTRRQLPVLSCIYRHDDSRSNNVCMKRQRQKMSLHYRSKAKILNKKNRRNLLQEKGLTISLKAYKKKWLFPQFPYSLDRRVQPTNYQSKRNTNPLESYVLKNVDTKTHNSQNILIYGRRLIKRDYICSLQ